MDGNFAGDIIQLLLAMAAVALVLYLFYLLSKVLAKKVNSVSKTNNIQVIERVALTQDKGLVLGKIGGKYYLIGYSTNSISILKELNEAELHFSQPPNSLEKSTFFEMLNTQIKSRLDLIISDKFRHKAAEDTDFPFGNDTPVHPTDENKTDNGTDEKGKGDF